MYTQNLNPTGSLALSALLASLPLLALLVALGVFKWRAHWAGTARLNATGIPFAWPLTKHEATGSTATARSVRKQSANRVLELRIAGSTIAVNVMRTRPAAMPVIRRPPAT